MATDKAKQSGGTLEAVLSQAARSSSHAGQVHASGDMGEVDLDLLDANPYQPRAEIDEAKLGELAASIKQSGLLQPIAVRPSASGRYTIIAGHRRVAAFRKLREGAPTDEERLKYSRIKAHLMLALGDAEMAVSAYVENVQRDSLNPIEEAAALSRLRSMLGVETAKDLAEKTGQNEQRIRRLLRLNNAPPVIRDAVTAGLLVPVEGDQAGHGEKRRRETRRLDLLGALEFVRLFEHLTAKKPKNADERVANTVRRALSEGWGLRRIQDAVQSVVDGRAPQDASEGGEAPRAVALMERTSKRFVLQLSRVESAPSERIADAVRALKALVCELEAKLSSSAGHRPASAE